MAQAAGLPSADYRPEEDVKKLAHYFAQRYGSLEKALHTFDPYHEFELYDFEVALKKWGVKVDSVVHLFDHIDVDWNNKISVEELFAVLQLPVAEVQEREERRKRDEVKRAFEQVAKCLRVKYHSVEEAVAKHSPQDPGASEASTLSLARFRTLVNGLGLQFDAALLQRVFYEIDQNHSGTVSISELQRALSNIMVHDELVELAETLAGRHGGDIDAAFKDLGDLQHPNSLDKFLRLLRHLKVFEVTEDMARLMFSCLRPNFTIEEFIVSLKEVRRQSQEEKRRQEEEQKRKDREQKRKLKQAMMQAVSRQQVEKEVQNWAQKAAEASSDEVMQNWSVAARAGKSMSQLKDYVSVLKSCVDDTASETRDLRMLVEQETREVEGLRDYLAPTPSQGASTNVAWSGEVSPLTPRSPYLTPASRTPRPQSVPAYADISRKSKAEKAQQLIQAAAAGDVIVVQSCLNARVDINLVGWGGVTALMAAARHGRQAVLEALVTRQADLQRTDMSGRTAVDHAYRQLRARDWLRSRGGLSSKELEADAEALAKLLLQAENEKSKLQARRDRMPSREVVQTAKLRQAQRHNLLEVPQAQRFGMPQWAPPGPPSAPPMGVQVGAGLPHEPWSPTPSDMSPGISPGMPPMRSALATGAPGSGAPKHVRLDCLPPRRPNARGCGP